jgi:hypothetical protein
LLSAGTTYHGASDVAVARIGPDRLLVSQLVILPIGPLRQIVNQQRLLFVLDYVRAARPDGPCWIWAERRAPEPIEAPDIGRWPARWSEGRAVYISSRMG